jgi:hypothetical protein
MRLPVAKDTDNFIEHFQIRISLRAGEHNRNLLII